MFRGAFTAIVTPFGENGEVDYAAYRSLIEFQLEQGVDGIVPVGTTGESPTLDFQEHHRVIETAVEACRGRALVIAGTGGNSTREALELTRRARDAGADGSLQVTPYYNKPSQAGLIRHFEAVAEVGLPTVLYNIPGRSALAIELETVQTLAAHPHIVAIKEAAGSVDRVSRLVGCCDLDVLSGDDILTLPMMAVGAVGVISVASNLIPGPVAAMVHAALQGDWTRARELHRQYHRLFCAMFLETNPVPVKTALGLVGRIRPDVRLPLCALSEAHQAELAQILAAYDLLPESKAT
jgi:4-hydroxy-tetrahydrodipicolinate synthase